MNPGLIYCTNSGFGPKGEWAEKPSFDGIAQAFSGAMVHQGGGPTQGTPSLVSWAFSDEVGGLNYALSIVQALYARERTGLGQQVETSQLGATVAFQYIGLAAALHQPDHRPLVLVEGLVQPAEVLRSLDVFGVLLLRGEFFSLFRPHGSYWLFPPFRA